MMKLRTTLILIFLIIMTGCRTAEVVLPATDLNQEPTGAPTVVVNVTQMEGTQQPSPEPATSSTTASGPADMDAPTNTAASPTAKPPESAEDLVLTPTLFPGTWDERDIYRRGLVPGEEGILDQLAGATVYHLDLDISDPHLVTGKMEARYTNLEAEPLGELMLHLFPENLGGGMEISDVLVNGRPVQFETANGMLLLALEEPLEPHQDAIVSLSFATAVPGDETTKYGVLAFRENILALAHFYPMFAVYDDQGWHTEPTADHGDETFSDISFYLVRITAPEDNVLVAAGVEVDRQEADAKQSVTFAAGPVRDFYLVASDNLAVVQEQIGPILVSSYAPPDVIGGARMALEVAVHALESFETHFSPYPYNKLDIVSTPTDALGIEYPGIFANALRIYDLAGSSAGGLPNAVLLESTTAHEMGHQWFYNLVGSDQLNEPWLDESTAQYATWLYFLDRYGAASADGFYDSLESRWQRNDFADIPIGLPADAYSGLDYGAIVYGRGPIFLHELEDLMGEEVFAEFLRDYSEQYRWQIAYGEDFMELAEEHCGCDLSDIFAEQVFGQ